MMRIIHRKLLVTAILFVAATILCMIGEVTGIDLLHFYKWLAGIYITGNIGAKFMGSRNGNGNSTK